MATNSKPSTSFYINYGALASDVAQRSLAPVLIAPRYKLHRIDAGYGETKLLELSAAGVPVTGDAPTYPLINSGATLIWPDNEGILDRDSVRIFAVNPELIINDTEITGEVSEGATNCLTVDGSVQLNGTTLIEALRGHEVLPGDKVVVIPVGDTESLEYTAEIVDVLPTYAEATASINAVAGDASQVSVDMSAYRSKYSTSYLVNVVNVTDGKVTATIIALGGDTGYSDTVAFDAENAAEIGSYGVMIKGSANAGDSFVISCAPEAIKAWNKLYLNTAMPVGAAVVKFVTNRLSSNKVALPVSAWDFAADGGITLSSDLKLSIADLTYTVKSADIHAEYRELLTEDSLELRTNQVNDIRSWVGPIDPDNPMGMMYAAASQVDGAFFYLLATEDATEEGTLKAIDYVAQFEQVYALVPYLQTAAVKAAVIATIDKYSSPTIAQFKHAWLFSTNGRESVIYSEDFNGSALVGSVTAGSGKAGILTLHSTSANMLASGVKSGDVAVIIGGYDANTGYSEEHEYVIDRVTGEATAELRNARLHGVSRVYIKRKLNATEYAESLAEEARAINNRHINFVASDTLNFAGFSNVSTALLCATLATMRAVYAPHAPLNDIVVPGFTVTNTLKWSDGAYEIMNAGGVWVVAKNAEGGLVTFHQITTRTDGTMAEEDSVVSNAEEIVRRLRLAVRPYASGSSNVTNAILQKLSIVLIAEFEQIQNEYYPETYGSRILNYSIDQLYVPAGNKRSIMCSCSLELPQPLQDGVFNFNLF